MVARYEVSGWNLVDRCDSTGGIWWNLVAWWGKTRWNLVECGGVVSENPVEFGGIRWRELVESGGILGHFTQAMFLRFGNF